MDDETDVKELRARIAALEQENVEQARRANAAIAAAQARAYWLDRWHVDLNALMQQRGASEFRAAVRVARAVSRRTRRVRQRLAKVSRAR
jgi:hypothetical protein